MSKRLLNSFRGALGALVLLSGYECYRQLSRGDRLREQIVVAEQRLEDEASKRYEAERLVSEIEALRLELKHRRTEVEETVLAKAERRMGADQEGLVGEWLDRIWRLDGFMKSSPDLCIPELKLLTPNDWLDACNVDSLENEAEYRLALTELRLLAKVKVAGRLSAAFSRYAESEEGELSIAAFLDGGYLDESIDPAILERFRLSDPKNEHSVRFVGEWKLVEEVKVDELWDSTLFIGPNRSFGYSQPSSDLDSMKTAMINFEREEGRLAASGSELLPYLSNSHEKEKIDEIFRAMTTKVSLPPDSRD